MDTFLAPTEDQAPGEGQGIPRCHTPSREVVRHAKPSSVPRGQGLVAACVEYSRAWVEGVGGYFRQGSIDFGGRTWPGREEDRGCGLSKDQKQEENLCTKALGAQPSAGASKCATALKLSSNPET